VDSLIVTFLRCPEGAGKAADPEQWRSSQGATHGVLEWTFVRSNGLTAQLVSFAGMNMPVIRQCS
jgi:hypothetical protein